MPRVPTLDEPETLAPYTFHGLEFSYRRGDDNALATCPWCGREGKFSVKLATGQWRCFVCNEGNNKGGGNAVLFLRKLHDMSFEATRPADYRALADERGYMNPDTPLRWGLAKSLLTDEWLVPGYGVSGKLTQLYRYVQRPRRNLLMGTKTLPHALFGVPLYNSDCVLVMLCEGPWDGMALWETLGSTKRGEGLASTANPDNSLLTEASVLAIPGCGSVGKPIMRWRSLFSGKVINLLFDNDLPKPHPKTGKTVPPAGLEAAKRAAALLSEYTTPPEAIYYLRWGPEGYNTGLPAGMDVRDWLAFRSVD